MSTSDLGGIETLPEPIATREGWLDPFDWYARMRREAPVRYDARRECWDVFRYDDVRTVLKDYERFTSDLETGGPEEADPGCLETMVRVDPPRHDELRGVFEESFRPGTVRELEPRIRTRAREILADALDGDDRMDVVEDLAYPLPVIVIAELLGAPPEDRHRFKEWSEDFIASDGDASSPEEDRALREMDAYFQELLEARRDDPGDDLLSTMVAAERDEDVEFSRRDSLATSVLLLVAGHATTTVLLGNAIRCFDEQGLLAALATDELDVRSAVEEVLRYRSPFQAISRVATTEVTLGGGTMEPGDRVVCWIGSANRDAAQFDDPGRFVPDRSPNDHLAFGHGPHYCLGAPLSRLEAAVALTELFDRVDDVEVVDTELQPIRSTVLHGVQSLPVRVRPAGTGGRQP